MNFFCRNTTPHQLATSSGKAAYVLGVATNKTAFNPYFYGSKRIVAISAATNTRLGLEHKFQDYTAVSRNDWSIGFSELPPVDESSSRKIFLSS